VRGFGFWEWLLLAAVWMACTFGGGAALAWLYKRLHPELAFYKLWAMWSMVLGGAATVVLAFVGF
jgi:predicted lysophospholipase L1 biosynthesis ABC-type transport system permease subunit